ncbi:MAG: G5 domain-containing protein [Candidatus Moranbacteria bacterium]|nr:G5 domain-containing protein [Candidatus Moranbacteria bacterium]
MGRFSKLKKALLIIGFLFLIGLVYRAFFVTPEKISLSAFDNMSKKISVNDNGLFFTTRVSADTINGFLKESGIELDRYDEIIPTGNTELYPGAQIIINRATEIEIQVDNTVIKNYSTAKKIGDILDENKITLGRLDKVSPDIAFGPQADSPIIVTRINVEEKTIAEDIDFKTITNTDSELGWREEKITQKGEKGIKEIKYRITYKNNKEISRIVLEKNITKDPVTQITTQGTHMELGKTAKGQATWYAFKGGMFAASTTIPKGAYAKVTNTANGKSIVVQINDYGPQGKGRIIDLDKVAFAKIASLGAGVIGVKVERILN